MGGYLNLATRFAVHSFIQNLYMVMASPKLYDVLMVNLIWGHISNQTRPYYSTFYLSYKSELGSGNDLKPWVALDGGQEYPCRAGPGLGYGPCTE